MQGGQLMTTPTNVANKNNKSLFFKKLKTFFIPPKVKSQKHTVAFVGDGVNDVLALREADCGIALASGSGASKQVSKVVLLDSDFTHLPDVVKEGRRVINNMTKAGGIFFVKTIYSVILSVLLVILNMPFPFLPVQITLIDLAVEGFPSLFLSLEKSPQKLKGTFLSNSFTRALPFAIMVVAVCCIMFVVGAFSNMPPAVLATIMYITLGFISVCAAVRACLPPNKLRVFLILATGFGYFFAVWLFSYGISMIFGIDFNFLELTLPLEFLWIPIVLSISTVPFMLLLSRYIRPKGLLYEKQKSKIPNRFRRRNG